MACASGTAEYKETLGCCQYLEGTSTRIQCDRGLLYEKHGIGPDPNVQGDRAASQRDKANNQRRREANTRNAREKKEEKEADEIAQSNKFEKEMQTFASTYPFCEPQTAAGKASAKWECCSFPGAYASAANKNAGEDDVDPYIYQGEFTGTKHLAKFDVDSYEQTVKHSKFYQEREDYGDDYKLWETAQLSFQQKAKNGVARTCSDLPPTPLCQLFFVKTSGGAVPCVYKPVAGINADIFKGNFGLTAEQKALVYTMVTRIKGVNGELDKNTDSNCQHVDCDSGKGEEVAGTQFLNGPFIGMSDEDLLAEYSQLVQQTSSSKCQSSERSCDLVDNDELHTAEDYEMDLN